jgi:hypothetical protein
VPPDDPTVAVTNFPDAAMLIELELKLDIARGGSGIDGLPAALVDGVCYHRGISSRLI